MTPPSLAANTSPSEQRFRAAISRAVWHSEWTTFQQALEDALVVSRAENECYHAELDAAGLAAPTEATNVARQSGQRAVNIDGQRAEGVDEPFTVAMEKMCQRLEYSLDRVADRLEATFEAKLFAALSVSTPVTFQPQTLTAVAEEEVGGGQLESIQAYASRRSADGENGGELESIEAYACRRSANGEKSESSGQKSSSVTQSHPTKHISFATSASSVDAGLSLTSSALRRGMHIAPSTANMTDHSHIDSVIRRSSWEIGQLQKGDTSHSWFEKAYQRKVHEKSMFHEMLVAIGVGKFIPAQAPENVLVNIASASWFHGMAAGAVILGLVFNAIEADQRCRLVLMDPPEKPWAMWKWLNIGVNLVFTVELLVRLAAYHAWFFVDPEHSRWNLFDLCIVCTSWLFFATADIDLYFLRVLRTLKVIRVARVFRIANAFTELRKLLLSIIASVASLMWAVSFLLLTMFIFSIFILQGIYSEIDSLDGDPDMLALTRNLFNGMLPCLKTLFILIVGSDWLESHELLSRLGFFYSLTMPVFVIFVNIGVMNIVVGVFAEAASGCRDHNLIAQDEIGNVEDFIGTMLFLWRENAGNTTDMDWESFKEHFYDEEMQAYLAFHQIDASHAHLLFELCDRDKSNTVDIREFCLGLLRCKGSARHLHTKVIVHTLSALAQDLECIRFEVRRIAAATGSAVK